jgi:hypothetical protein
LLDDGVLINQLCSLEHNVSRGGQETIPPKDRRDDVVNAAAGALVNVSYECAPRIMRYEDFLHGGEPVELCRIISAMYRWACDGEGKAAVIGWKVNQYLNPRWFYAISAPAIFPIRSLPIIRIISRFSYSQCGMAKTCALVPVWFEL